MRPWSARVRPPSVRCDPVKALRPIPLRRALAARAAGSVGAALSLALLALMNPAHAHAAPRCEAVLSVVLSPEVPNPRDPGFLSSLAGKPGYSLVWLGSSPASFTQRLQLTGPGPDYRCRREIRRMRADARVQRIRVLSSR